MGLNPQHQEGSKTYLKIKDGKFYLNSDKEFKTPYASLEGTLKGIRTRNARFESGEVEMLEVIVESGGDYFSFSLNFDSLFCLGFLNFLCNTNLSLPMTITPKALEDDGRTRRVIFISQNGKPVKAKYTKANPGDLPPLKPVVFKGKETWDNTDQLNFYRKKVEELNLQVGGGSVPQGVTEHREVVLGTQENPTTGESDYDLPF